MKSVVGVRLSARHLVSIASSCVYRVILCLSRHLVLVSSLNHLHIHLYSTCPWSVFVRILSCVTAFCVWVRGRLLRLRSFAHDT
jgi:hypothetical protein